MNNARCVWCTLFMLVIAAECVGMQKRQRCCWWQECWPGFTRIASAFPFCERPEFAEKLLFGMALYRCDSDVHFRFVDRAAEKWLAADSLSNIVSVCIDEQEGAEIARVAEETFPHPVESMAIAHTVLHHAHGRDYPEDNKRILAAFGSLVAPSSKQLLSVLSFEEGMRPRIDALILQQKRYRRRLAEGIERWRDPDAVPAEEDVNDSLPAEKRRRVGA